MCFAFCLQLQNALDLTWATQASLQAPNRSLPRHLLSRENLLRGLGGHCSRFRIRVGWGMHSAAIPLSWVFSDTGQALTLGSRRCQRLGLPACSQAGKKPYQRSSLVPHLQVILLIGIQWGRAGPPARRPNAMRQRRNSHGNGQTTLGLIILVRKKK